MQNLENLPILLLYTTSGCHLCAIAENLLHETLGLAQFQPIEIADDEALLACYGLRIPVLQRADTKAELDWPFDAAMISHLVGLSTATSEEHHSDRLPKQGARMD